MPERGDTSANVPPVRRRSRRASLLLVGAGALVLVLVLALVPHSDGARGSPYVTELVERGPLAVSVRAVGTLAPRQQVDVRSELAGVAKTVEVVHGARVNRGRVLARLDTTQLALDLEHARATLEAARAKLLHADAAVDEAKAQLARLDQVHARSNGRVPSLQEVALQRAAVKRAEAERAAVRAELQHAEATLASLTTARQKAVIRAPIDGVVLARALEPGQAVAASPSSPALFTIASDLRTMVLVLGLDETAVGHAVVGQRASFLTRAFPDRVFEATLAEVRLAPEIVDGTATYTTVLEVDNADLALRPGMTAEVSLPVREVEDAVLVPNEALQFTPEPATSGLAPRGAGTERHVWVLRGEDTLAIPIVVGLSDGTKTEVRDGALAPGERVLVGIANDIAKRSESRVLPR
jgi:HlyD family secretion protein